MSRLHWPLLLAQFTLGGALLGVAAPAQAVSPVTATQVETGLTRPLGFVQHPTDPDVQFIVDQGGLILVRQNGVILPTPLLDLTGQMGITDAEGGLHSLAFPADYPADPCFYIGHGFFGGGVKQSLLVRYQHNGNPLEGDASTREVLLTIPETERVHNIDELIFGADGMLYISKGDGGPQRDTDGDGQNIETLHATIMRLDVSGGPGSGYTIPPDNPMVDEPGRDEIWHYGLRNPWRISFDDGPCGRGGMFIGDTGQGSWEEIDFVPPGMSGFNFGWSCMEGPECTSFGAKTCQCDDPGFRDPLYSYAQGDSTGRAIIGGYVYRGRDMPHNRGRYFFGDFISGRVWSLGLSYDPMTGEATVDNVVDHTTELFDGPGQVLISSFGEDAQGELYVLDHSGAIYRIDGAMSPADANLDGAVDGADLGLLLQAWGDDSCGPSDLNNDEIVNGADLGLLLQQWSPAN